MVYRIVLSHSPPTKTVSATGNSLKPLATTRSRKTQSARRFLGLFVLAWLNMALQPCAMAFGDASAGGCNQCPMTDSAEVYLQGSVEITGLESGMSRCAVVDDLNYDDRTTKVKTKDAPSDVPLDSPYIADAGSFAINSSVYSPMRRNLYSPGIPPTFIVFYGVYLI